MATSSLGMAGGKIAQMALGFGFWVVAARLSTPGEVGAANAVSAAVMLSSQVALLGLGAAVITHLPAVEDKRRLVGLAVGMVLLSSVVVASVAVGLGAVGLSALGPVASDVGLALAFVLAVLAGSTGVLFDNVSMSTRRGHEVMVRNVTAGLVAIAALAVLSRLTPTNTVVLIASWMCGPACLVLMGLWQSTRRGLAPRLTRPDRHHAGLLLSSSVPNYVLALSERAPLLAVPLIIVQFMGAESSAHWYVVWMMTWAVLSLPVSFGTGLFAEGRHRLAALGSLVRRSARLVLPTTLVAGLSLAVLGPQILSIVGPTYLADGVTPLRVLLLGVLPAAVTQLYIGVCRAALRLRSALLLGGVSCLMSIVATTAAAVWGGTLVAVSLAWTAVQVVVGVVAAILLLRAIATA